MKGTPIYFFPKSRPDMAILYKSFARKQQHKLFIKLILKVKSQHHD